MPEPAELLQRFASTGDQAAFTAVVEQSVNLVYSAALRQVGGDAHLAREVSQQVFLALAQSASRLSGHPSLAGWLYTTTRQLAQKAVRSQKRWQGREQEATTMRLEDQAAVSPDWAQVQPVLDEAMHQLNARDREALLLRFFENQSFAAIGQQSQLAENAARMRVERALEKLRLALASRGVTSTAAALAGALSASAVTAAPTGLAASAATAALAGWTAGGAGALSVFATMTTTKTALGVVTALFVLAAGTATYEAISLHQIRQAGGARSPSALSTTPDAAEANPQPIKQTTTNHPANSSAPAPGGTSFASVVQMMADPRAELAAKNQLATQYAGLFARLHLPADQVESLKNLLTEKRSAAVDAMAASTAHGLTPTSNPREFYTAVVMAEAPVNQSIKTLLGSDGYTQYEQYSAALPVTNTVHQMQQALSYTSTPLTDDQAAQLTQTLRQNSPAPVPEPFQLLNIDIGVATFTPQAKSQVASFLSASQIQALDEQISNEGMLLKSRTNMK